MASRGSLEEFDPANPGAWKTYANRVAFYLDANDISNVGKKHSTFLSLCGPQTFELAQSLLAPAELDATPFPAIMAALGNHFNPQPTQATCRLAFHLRDQEPGESATGYIATLRTAACSCEFPDLNDRLCNRFVFGLRSEKLRLQLVAKKDLTLTAAIEEATVAESSSRPSRLGDWDAPPPRTPAPVHHESASDVTSSDEDEAHKLSDQGATQGHWMRGAMNRPYSSCGERHDRRSCRFCDASCRACGRVSHIAKVCCSAPKGWLSHPARKDGSSRPVHDLDDDEPTFGRQGRCKSELHSISLHKVHGADKVSIAVEIGGAPCEMEVDSGSALSIISLDTYRDLARRATSLPELPPSGVTIWDYQRCRVPVRGEARMPILFQDRSGLLRLIVVEGPRASLLGLDWFLALGLHIGGIHRISQTALNDIWSEFEDVWKGPLGCYKGPPVRLHIDPAAAPIRLKPRRVPFALKPQIDAELNCLVTQGVLVPVPNAPWETPIVMPLKPNGDVRICTDYKCTINTALWPHAYPVPVVSHLLASLTGGREFAKLDLAQAYQQLPVDPESAEAQTIVTHRGTFRVTSLQFRVSTAPGIFQNLMENLLKGLPGVVPYFDDSLIAASSNDELLKRVHHHKPLLGLFVPDHQTPQILSPRMLRWSIFLNAYDFRLLHRPGSSIANADALSRLPLKDSGPDPSPAYNVMLLETLPELPLHASDIAAHIAKDRTLARILNWVGKGWPAARPDGEFKPFSMRQHELSLNKGCLLWGNCVVVPAKLRTKVLEALHACHPGVVRMKALARSYVWWPGIDAAVEEWVSRCRPCQESWPEMPRAPTHHWDSTHTSWSRLHIDFAGPFQGKTFLIVMDSYSKWLEVVNVGSMTSPVVVRELQKIFATHGLPDTVVSDNGAQFTSAEFHKFLTKNGICHTTSALFHPATNGQAERMVRTTKEVMRQLLMGRRLKTPLDRLHPNLMPECPCHKEDPAVLRVVEQDAPVYARNYRTGPAWIPATVQDATGPVSYRVATPRVASSRDTSISCAADRLMHPTSPLPWKLWSPPESRSKSRQRRASKARSACLPALKKSCQTPLPLQQANPNQPLPQTRPQHPLRQLRHRVGRSGYEHDPAT
uniref:uncharacterized protein K02A2.6-like n=1 Tax=Euleptes europaea TaxID=460621 RepID=UPI0025418138|nr:uncharacterized protein K02A2.6-like [Euleptes europaea]